MLNKNCALFIYYFLICITSCYYMGLSHFHYQPYKTPLCRETSTFFTMTIELGRYVPLHFHFYKEYLKQSL